MKTCLILILTYAYTGAAFAQPLTDTFFYDPKTGVIYRRFAGTGAYAIHTEGMARSILVSPGEVPMLRPLQGATVKIQGTDVTVKSVILDDAGRAQVKYVTEPNAKPIQASLNQVTTIKDKPFPKGGIADRLAKVGLGVEEPARINDPYDPRRPADSHLLLEHNTDPNGRYGHPNVVKPQAYEAIEARALQAGAGAIVEDTAANQAIGRGMAADLLARIRAAIGVRAKLLIPGIGTAMGVAEGIRLGSGFGPAAASANDDTYCATQEGVQKLLTLPRESAGAKRPKFASDNLEMTYEQVLETPGCAKKLEALADNMLKYKEDSSKCSESGAATFQMSRVDDGIDRIEGNVKYDEYGAMEKLTIKNLFTGNKTEFIMKDGKVVETIEPKGPEKRFDSISAQKARERTAKEIKTVAQSFLIAEDNYLKQCPKLMAQRRERRNKDLNLVQVADASAHTKVTADGAK